jgi:hypothetical protein
MIGFEWDTSASALFIERKRKLHRGKRKSFINASKEARLIVNGEKRIFGGKIALTKKLIADKIGAFICSLDRFVFLADALECRH